LSSMTAKCHPAETVWGEGHGGVPAMGVVRLLGKQQPDKQCRFSTHYGNSRTGNESLRPRGKNCKAAILSDRPELR
jgi:hypothetical protein